MRNVDTNNPEDAGKEGRSGQPPDPSKSWRTDKKKGKNNNKRARVVMLGDRGRKGAEGPSCPELLP